MELLLALLLGGLVLQALSQIVVFAWGQSMQVTRRGLLQNTLLQLLDPLEKDLRRAGFCAGDCRAVPPKIAALPGEPAKSCVLIFYDLNTNGVVTLAGNDTDEVFGYRLRSGSLETTRSLHGCETSHGERISDEKEIQVTRFEVQRWQRGYQIILTVQRRTPPYLPVTGISWVFTENL